MASVHIESTVLLYLLLKKKEINYKNEGAKKVSLFHGIEYFEQPSTTMILQAADLSLTSCMPRLPEE